MGQVRVTVRAKQLLEILARRNISQNGLGRGAGLTGGYVSQIISGRRNVSPAARSRILGALPDVKFDEIFEIRIGRR